MPGPRPPEASPAAAVRLVAAAVLVAALLLPAPGAQAAPRKDMYTSVGLIGLTVTNLGYVGNGLANPGQPSCEYPLNSHVEHVFLGGLWVGAVTPDGSIHVSTGAQDASNLSAGEEIREFTDTIDEPPLIWSNSQNSDNYDPRALATQHIQVCFNDYATVESGTHVPLGLNVTLRALAYGTPYADDFVVLDYQIVNISGGELRDVYVGYWTDTTVGNTERNNPYDSSASVRWNYYDDVNGAWGPREWVPSDQYAVQNDPNIWMSYERDDDGDDGMATSWVGARLLGSVPAPQPAEGTAPVSYNAWRFRGVPATDDVNVTPDGVLPGKYQIMSNGDFDVGETQEEDYTIPSDWVSLLSTGPFHSLGPGDTLRVSFAIVCGPDSLGLLANSKVAQVAYDHGFSIPGGPPSPRLSVATDNDAIILRWAPGDSTALGEGDRAPEYSISNITGRPNFEGYRIYRYQGRVFGGDPYVLASLVAQYDKIDGVGFDTGLPPLNAQGEREFRDEHLRDGFPYWYSVTSFSPPDLQEGLPEYPSGFNENAVLVFPGPAPSTPERPGTIGVYPNPYRAGSYFDATGGERELGRKIWFRGLPARCRIQVFNLAGDPIRTFEHDDPTTGQEAWDILSDPGRPIATGLYIYVVTDLDTGEVQRGKLVIIK